MQRKVTIFLKSSNSFLITIIIINKTVNVDYFLNQKKRVNFIKILTNYLFDDCKMCDMHQRVIAFKARLKRIQLTYITPENIY